MIITPVVILTLTFILIKAQTLRQPKKVSIHGRFYVIALHNMYGDGSDYDEVSVRLNLMLRFVLLILQPSLVR